MPPWRLLVCSRTQSNAPSSECAGTTPIIRAQFPSSPYRTHRSAKLTRQCAWGKQCWGRRRRFRWSHSTLWGSEKKKVNSEFFFFLFWCTICSRLLQIYPVKSAKAYPLVICGRFLAIAGSFSVKTSLVCASGRSEYWRDGNAIPMCDRFREKKRAMISFPL